MRKNTVYTKKKDAKGGANRCPNCSTILALIPTSTACRMRTSCFVYINDWTKQHTRAEIEKIIADEFRQAYSPVLRVSEVITNEQFLARDMIVDMEGPMSASTRCRVSPSR